MNWWEKGQYYLYKMFNHAFGSSEAGAIVGNIINVGSYVHEKKMECLKSIRDWFAHGDGKYVLNIALAAIAAIGAVVAVILTFPAGTILATIVLMATIIASIVTITDSGAKIVENVKALKMNSTEPGQARYYGNTSDLTDFAMKESTDKEQQDRAKWIDTTGKIAGFVAFVGGFGVTRNRAGTNVTSPGFKNGKGCVLENIGGKFGFKYDATAKANHFSFDPKGFLGFGKETVEGTKLPNWYKTLDKINNNAIAPSERALKLLQGDTSWDGHFDGHKDTTRIISQLSNIHPGFKGYDKIISYGKDFYDFVTGSDPVSKVKPMQFSTYHGGGKF